MMVSRFVETTVLFSQFGLWSLCLHSGKRRGVWQPNGVHVWDVITSSHRTTITHNCVVRILSPTIRPLRTSTHQCKRMRCNDHVNSTHSNSRSCDCYTTIINSERFPFCLTRSRVNEISMQLSSAMLNTFSTISQRITRTNTAECAQSHAIRHQHTQCMHSVRECVP